MPTLAKLAYLLGGRKTPITILEQSGRDLIDYQIKVSLTSAWDGWGRVKPDASDIYFLDDLGNPLYFWIEDWDYANKSATIWVKVPKIPASSKITIYMHYAGVNPFVSYRNPSEVFMWFVNGRYFIDPSTVSGSWVVNRFDKYIVFQKTSSAADWEVYRWVLSGTLSAPFEIEGKAMTSIDIDSIHTMLFQVNGADIVQYFFGRDDAASAFFPTGLGFKYVYDIGANGWDAGGGLGSASPNVFYIIRARVLPDSVILVSPYESTTLNLNMGATPTIYVSVEGKASYAYASWEYVFIKKYVSPEPLVSLQASISAVKDMDLM